MNVTIHINDESAWLWVNMQTAKRRIGFTWTKDRNRPLRHRAWFYSSLRLEEIQLPSGRMIRHYD